MSNLIQELDRLYRNGQAILSDVEYDALVAKFSEGDSLVGDGDCPHLTRMYSLEKYYVGDTLPSNLDSYVKTPKLDGAAVCLIYSNGNLVAAHTRGDGFKGKDVTLKCTLLPSVIKTIPNFSGQVNGEVAITKSVLNERNFAAGALNTINLEEFLAKVTEGGIVFVPTSIIQEGPVPTVTDSYSDDLLFLKQLGFLSVFDVKGCPTDGTVYRLDSNTKYFEAGFTAKFPKGAFALKERDEEVETTLLDVIWQVGRTGKVTPVAVLEPVKIGDATIQYATLNNYDYIKALGLYYGCRVKLVRAGKIIPKIVGLVD